MGNSCNKVTPIVCTARITCTVPIGCTTAESKGQLAVVEPKRKHECNSAYREGPPPGHPAPPPSNPGATASLATPNGETRPPSHDPVESFQASGSLSSYAAAKPVESVNAVKAPVRTPTTSSANVGLPKAATDLERVQGASADPVEEDSMPKRTAAEGPVGVVPASELSNPAVSGPKHAGCASVNLELLQQHATAEETLGKKNAAAGAATAKQQAEDTADAVSSSLPASSFKTQQRSANEAAGQSSLRQAEVPDEDESPVDLQPFAFDPDAIPALERFQLKHTAEALGSRLSGHAAAQALQSMSVFASDAGAATQNCQLLLAQIRTIACVLASGQARSAAGSHPEMASLLTQLHPALLAAQEVIGGWRGRGSVERFMSGRAADDDFLEVHLQLRDFAQSPAFVRLFSSLPPAEAAQLAADQQAQQERLFGGGGGGGGGGYCSVEASRAAFERLLLLFILRYKPARGRTQRDRLFDLLATYNSPSEPPPCAAACVGGDGGPDAQLEHLARVRLGRAATHSVPLMTVLMTSLWGVEPTEVPRSLTDKWRLAVRLAVEPLRAATGSCQLPVVPVEGVQPWDEEEP